jgi:hypothetical protein
MAAGEASVDICSLLGLEIVCVVPVGWPRVWAGGSSSAGMEDWGGVDDQREAWQKGGPSAQTSIRLGNGSGKNGLGLRESVRTYSVQ